MAMLLDGLDWSRVAQPLVKRPTKAGLSPQFCLENGAISGTVQHVACAQKPARDPDILIAMIIERDIEIERLQTMLKTVNALIYGLRLEKLGSRASMDFRALPPQRPQEAAK
jgi:hypothetical protein